MSSEHVENLTTTRQPLETGPFVLRSLLDDIPLSADGDRNDIKINCVEFLDSNLYIGTSASEILHFVQIPPDPDEPNDLPSYILATRLPPQGESTNSRDKPGVQQILLLPRVQKSIVLCNGIITFYSLPELSPIFENISPLKGCGWVGGVDLNIDARTVIDDPTASITVLLSLKSRLRAVNIGSKAKALKTIDYIGSIISVRRDYIACVADNRSYALLDIDQQLKIPLFPISSSDIPSDVIVGGRAEDVSGDALPESRTAVLFKSAEPTSHSRESSLGTLISTARHRASSFTTDTNREQMPERPTRAISPSPAASPIPSGQHEIDVSKLSILANQSTPTTPLLDATSEPATISTQVQSIPVVSNAASTYLKPHIVSPSAQEFLLVTGTGPLDPGVGMFVNLDGDVTRSTLEFERYPESLVVDGRGQGIDLDSSNADDEEEGYVIAALGRGNDNETVYGLEIQRWDLDPAEGHRQKSWLPLPADNPISIPDLDTHVIKTPGLRCVIDKGDVAFTDAVDKLRLRRFRPLGLGGALSSPRISLEEPENESHCEGGSIVTTFAPQPPSPVEDLPEGAEQLRDEEEQQFAKRLGQAKTRVVVWAGNKVWWVVRNPLTLRLDAGLPSMNEEADEAVITQDRQTTVEIINSIRGREAKTELEFVGLGYIRQKAGLLLLINLLSSDIPPLDAEDRIAEEALLSSGLDPRVILSLVPRLQQEIIGGKHGIWIHGGVLESARVFLSSSRYLVREQQYILQFFRRYLVAWRTKKGFGSITSEREIFHSLDAALLVVLLELDTSTPGSEAARPPLKGSVRYELYTLVDNGIECFDRAIQLLEHYNRLYVLSRLYQSRKMSAEVLATWRRIVESPDAKVRVEFPEGEQEFRKYLTKISSSSLVEEYGVWLAVRSTRLGIQVFADDKARVRFEPAQVVKILRKGAPSAVKEYLEYLVFAKNHTQHVNELISYYLDIVVSKLTDSQDAKDLLAQSYSSYRALSPPKPTYRQFITDNAIPDEWWHSRLRLLQLLGGTHGLASEYNVEKILQRIAPFTKHLVPELIILQGRREMHAQALELLVHDLGDFDTAINYCLLGGSSIYHPIRASAISATSSSAPEDQQTMLPRPTRTEQTHLFNTLLILFLKLEDISDRVTETTYLLSNYGSYFDIADVLQQIPDDWSIELISGFLLEALRKIVVEKRATSVVKAISGAENLAVSVEVANLCAGRGAVVERE